MRIENEKLKSFLVDMELVDADSFDRIENKAKEKNLRVDKVLVEEGLIDEERIARIKAHILGIPFINLEDATAEKEALRMISKNFAQANDVVPFKKSEKNLEIAMLNPGNLEVIESIKKSTGLNILPRLGTSKGIENILNQYEDSLASEVNKIVSEVDDDEDQVRVLSDDEEEGVADLEKAAKELPVVKIVDIIIKHAILERASDIHIEPEEDKVLIRYRIDGILRDMMELPAEIDSGVVARIKVLSNLKLDEHRLPQDGRFKIQKKDYKYSLRVSIMPVSEGEKVVMRLLPETNDAMSLEEVGFRGESLKKVEKSLDRKSGMILVTGPTGSGKTTTLYSVLAKMNTPKVNISTIEDPIEYKISRINQTQVKPKIGFTFASGLRALVRQDPDVIMVGEIRDSETAKLATNAALTGHQVLSTLHTTNAAGAASRLIDMEVEPFLVSSTVNVIIAQRLLRLLNHNSKEGYYLSDSQIDDLGTYCDLDKVHKVLMERGVIKEGESIKNIEFYKPVETEQAPDGYKGRIAAFEVLEVTEEIKDLIINRSGTAKINKEAQKQEMTTMFEDGLVKAAQGLTSIEEVLRVLTQ